LAHSLAPQTFYQGQLDASVCVRNAKRGENEFKITYL